MPIQSADVIHDFLIVGLKNAHAMESQAISLIAAQADRLRHYPDAEARVRQHLQETEGQRSRIDQCLRGLGARPNELKDAVLRLGATVASMVHSMGDDEVIKDALASYAFKNFEIAAYRVLIEAARLVDRPDIIAVCELNLTEEEQMATWLQQNQGQLVRAYLGRRSADAEARR